MPLPVVVDTNVLFSALLKGSGYFAEVLLRSEHQFYVCESVLMELFKHKEKILRLSRLEEDDLTRFYHVLLRHLHLHKEDLIAPEHWRVAQSLCLVVDESDTPRVALTLDCRVGSGRATGSCVKGSQPEGSTSSFLLSCSTRERAQRS